MSKVSFVCSKTASEITIFHTCFLQSGVHDRSEVTDYACCIRNRCRARNGSGNIVHAVVDNTFFDIDRIIMSRLAECLDATVIIADGEPVKDEQNQPKVLTLTEENKWKKSTEPDDPEAGKDETEYEFLSFDLGGVALSGMMPKGATATAVDVTEQRAEERV